MWAVPSRQKNSDLSFKFHEAPLNTMESFGLFSVKVKKGFLSCIYFCVWGWIAWDVIHFFQEHFTSI